MAIGDPYATLLELKNKLRITDTVDDVEMAAALSATSRGIEHCCGRQFNQTTTASARVFTLRRNQRVVRTDDFHTTTGLAIALDTADDDTFATAVTSDQYRLEPRNGIVDGEAGWPFWRIRLAFHLSAHPLYLHPFRRDSQGGLQVQVTAQWGWTAVPAPVHQACLILASELFKLRDAPFGVAGFGEYGAVRVRQNPLAYGLLRPYERHPALVG